ncbi:outer membrane beta-barrel protein [Spongiivirga citrea]|uniref:Outer membrane beta-barrel protein n=1 Tax=Spongiivirga citrea TaxID=1481457 RepID=A0A6M0CJT2_9FLAO|nr:outer membrane beta-barrel protein [Spongiivirga citrea]NER15697.1 outer membrane beta-barrel protein [Spongiivirga citrea]
MKKLLILVCLCLGFNATAQKALKKIQFGISSGVLNVNTKTDGIFGPDITSSDNFTGFYLGPMVQLSLTKKVGLQGEVLYGNANSEGYIIVPLQAKIGILPKLSLLLGPQANYAVDSDFGNTSALALDGVAGVALNITRKFAIQARYAIQINERAQIEDRSVKSNTLNIGIGYNF